MSQSLQTLITSYNTLVASINDLEKALATLVGSTDWETSVISNTSKSVQLLYAELKTERSSRDSMEAQLYDTAPTA